MGMPTREQYPFDRFDAAACQRWAADQGLVPGGNGYRYSGHYGTKGLYAYRQGEGRGFGGMCFFGTGGSHAAMDAPPRADQYSPHFETYGQPEMSHEH